MKPINPSSRRALERVLISLMCFAGGCLSVPKPEPASAPHLADNSIYLLHVSGVSGVTVFDAWFAEALKEAGAADDSGVFEWVGDRGILSAIRDIDGNRRIAGDIAKFVTALRRANPHARIALSSESAGAAMVIWALERLPSDVQVDSVMIAQPDVSPGYDLSAAMAHVNHHLFYTTSIFDFGTLGVWTRVLGTVDRVKGPGAGFVGFRAPAGADAAAYQRIVRVPWNPLAILFLHPGSHSTAISPPYARCVLGPMLAADLSGEK